MNVFWIVLASINLAVACYYAVLGHTGKFKIRTLADRDDPPAPDVSVTIIAPARNEERHVEAAVRSLLRQEHPHLQITLVNDRSTDRTGEILDRLAAEDSRVRVIHIDHLPDGWLGKNYALHQAGLSAESDMLLFADADVLMRPDTVARAVAYMEQEQLDHLTLGPELVLPSVWLDAFVVAFTLYFSAYFQPWKARDPKSPHYVGIGAFNMLRRGVFEQLGGMAPIRMRPDDDVKLGKIIKHAGYAQEFAAGAGLLRVPWYGSVRELIVGLEKNAFAGVDYRVGLIAFTSCIMLLMNVWPFGAVFCLTGAAQLLYAGVVATLLWSAARIAGEIRKNPLLALLFPVMTLLFVYIQWRSMLLAFWRGGIRWRDTQYSLAELRANRV